MIGWRIYEAEVRICCAGKVIQMKTHKTHFPVFFYKCLFEFPTNSTDEHTDGLTTFCFLNCHPRIWWHMTPIWWALKSSRISLAEYLSTTPNGFSAASWKWTWNELGFANQPQPFHTNPFLKASLFNIHIILFHYTVHIVEPKPKPNISSQ